MSALIGIGAAFATMIAAIWIGGAPAAYINLGGLLIVLGGTFAVVAASFRLDELTAMPRTLGDVLFRPHRDPAEAASILLKIAERTRRSGVLSVEKLLPALKDNPFLGKAMELVVDATDPAEIEAIMVREAQAIAEQHFNAVDILRRAGDVAPAMGLIGTLIGLVQMLGSLEDPAAIGPAMAVALLTTLYGATLANLVFLPLASRAERWSGDEALLHRLYTISAASMGRQENPRRLAVLLNSVLPPAKQLHINR